MRNLLATVLLSTGVPMLTAGDEMGRTQRGNNNAYCRDDELSWVDWQLADWQRDLVATTSHLTRLRREHPVLAQSRFFSGRARHADGTSDLAWFAADGTAMDDARWHDQSIRTVLALFDGLPTLTGGPAGDGGILLVLHGGTAGVDLTLPADPFASAYRLLWDSADERPVTGGWKPVGSAYHAVACSMLVLEVRRT